MSAEAGGSATASAEAGGATFRRVLESIGARIVAGELATGRALTVEGLVQQTAASRSIVREVVRVLVSLGILSAGRRVGLRVLARESWNLLDPQVIRWRLASTDRDEQLGELRALRAVIEPEAARAAAASRTDAQARELESLATELERAAEYDERAAFLDADRRLHGLLLAASGNGMFAHLHAVIDEALRDRAVGPAAVERTDARDVALHGELVAAIAGRDTDRAAELMREIVDRTA